MSLVRLAIILIFVLGSTPVLAERITCESHGGRTEACGAVAPGSSVQLIEQISSSPCIEGSTWGADRDSIWVSNGCRAMFDVRPRYRGISANYSGDDQPYDRTDRTRYYGARSARADSARNLVNNACVIRITTDQPFGADEIGTNDVRRVSDDLYVVSVNTPKGPMSCTVDRTGTVRSLDMDYR